MSKKKRTQPKAPAKPIGIHYKEQDGDFKLYKRWSKEKTASDPFYITDDLNEMIEEIQNCCKKWNCKVNLKELKQFIDKHNTETNEKTTVPKSYISQ